MDDLRSAVVEPARAFGLRVDPALVEVLVREVANRPGALPLLRKRAGKRRAWMRTPPTCPATGVWTTSVLFIYRDGSTQEHAPATPCQRG